ncbi:MAG: hypothetical protein ACD_19C00426G0123 [uncultured bacterium]|nr:MAG: hypothetical protein ACD_19C00426G0123 [uncultured bacterium]
MDFQKGQTLNNKVVPWNRGTVGLSRRGRKREGKNLECTGCGLVFYKQRSDILEYNFHSQKCYYQYIKNNKSSSLANSIRLKTSGRNNHNHKGIFANCSSLHKYISYIKGKATKCICCNSETNVNWANLSGFYFYDIDDFVERCGSCHKRYDTELGFPRKNSFDKSGKRIAIPVSVNSSIVLSDLKQVWNSYHWVLDAV